VQRNPNLFIGYLILYPFSKATLFKAFILATLMVISQVVVIAGYFGEGINRMLSKNSFFKF